MKNNDKIITILTVLLVLMSLSCATTSDHISVRIPVKNKKAIDFEKAKVVLYDRFKIENNPEGYEPQQQVEDFFLKDLSKYIKRDIQVLNDDTNKDGAFIFSGKMTFDIKERSVIRKRKSESGKKEKKFVTVQHWTLNFEIVITDSDSGKELFKKDYESKLKDTDPEEADYNFKSLFNKVTDNFIKEIIRKERFEQRYLLLR